MKNYSSNNPKEYILRALIIPCFFLAFGAIEAAIGVFLINIIIATVVYKRNKQILEERDRRWANNRHSTRPDFVPLDRSNYSLERLREFLHSKESAETFFHSSEPNIFDEERIKRRK